MTAIDPTPHADLVAYAGTWELVPAKSTVSFRTKAMWVLPVKGSAKAQSGSGTVSDAGVVEGQLVIDLTSISTGMKKRDADVQTVRFLDTAKHPTMQFTLDGVESKGTNRASLRGTLTIAGRSHPVAVDAEVARQDDGVVVTGKVADLNRADWGVTETKMGAGLHNEVEVTAFFTKA